MIDPNNIINYNRTDKELQELILFLICVAGKKASTVAVQLNKFLTTDITISPFHLIEIRAMERMLRQHLEKVRFGQYTKIERAFREIATSGFNLRTCTKEDLMKIHGIGRKSASCFLAWTRKGEEVAMLDTHLLKYLRYVKEMQWDTPYRPKLQKALDLLKSVEIPKSTPSTDKLYDALEQAYLLICADLEVDPIEFDLQIWKHYANGLDKVAVSSTL